MKLLHSLQHGANRFARVLFLSLCVFMSCLVKQPLSVYAANNVVSFHDTLSSSYDSWNYFCSASDNLSNSTTSGKYVYDVYIPFYLEYDVVSSTGDYNLSFDFNYLRLYPFRFDTMVSNAFKLNLSVIDITDSYFSSSGLTYNSFFYIDNVRTPAVGTSFSVPSVNSTVFPSSGVTTGDYLSFRWSMLDQSAYLSYNSYTKKMISQVFYIHLVFTTNYTGDFYFTFDSSNSVYTTFSNNFVLQSDKPISGEIQDVGDSVDQAGNKITGAVDQAGNKVSGAVGDVNNTIKAEHQEEIDKANQAGTNMGTSLTNVTNTLSTIEILKLPWTMLIDVKNAIDGGSGGNTVLKFPSFSLMGYRLWPSYEFDLNELHYHFAVILDSVRFVIGATMCVSFVNYLRSFFVKIFGNSESEGD